MSDLRSACSERAGPSHSGGRTHWGWDIYRQAAARSWMSIPYRRGPGNTCIQVPAEVPALTCVRRGVGVAQTTSAPFLFIKSLGRLTAPGSGCRESFAPAGNGLPGKEHLWLAPAIAVAGEPFHEAVHVQEHSARRFSGVIVPPVDPAVPPFIELAVELLEHPEAFREAVSAPLPPAR